MTVKLTMSLSGESVVSMILKVKKRIKHVCQTGFGFLGNILKTCGLETKLKCLESLEAELIAQGFEPLPMSIKDVNCGWVRVTGLTQPYVNISWDIYNCAKSSNNIMLLLKSECKIS